jgi:intein/homing endonuclease
MTKFTSDETKRDITLRYQQHERLSSIATSYGTRAQHINSLLRKWGVEPTRAKKWKRKGTLAISQG